MVISGISNIERLQEAFFYGATDYIMKPVRLKELELRVLNWFKIYYLINTPTVGNIHYYKDLGYSLDKNEFYYQETPIHLSKGNKYLLSIFFTHPEKLLQERFLVEKIWGDPLLLVERNLRVSILRLKNTLSPF